jgi:hypothetical protein
MMILSTEQPGNASWGNIGRLQMELLVGLMT